MSKIDPQYAKMDPSDRAKQFMPFAALKGYEEALRAKEAEIERGLSDVKVPCDYAPDSECDGK